MCKHIKNTKSKHSDHSFFRCFTMVKHIFGVRNSVADISSSSLYQQASYLGYWLNLSLNNQENITSNTLANTLLVMTY